MCSDMLFPLIDHSYILSFQFSSWYPVFSDLTIKSKIIRPLSQDFREYLDSESVFIPEGSEDVFVSSPTTENILVTRHVLTRPFQSELSDHSDDEDADEGPKFAFPELDAKIRECITEYGAVFPKLNFSSPKDASWVLPPSSPLKCTSPVDVYMLLKSSDFIAHDLDVNRVFDGSIAVDDAPLYELELVLRKWYPIDKSRELRCFVRQNRLLGITQRDTNYYDYLNDSETKRKLVSAVQDYWESNVRTRWKVNEDYVFDILMTRHLDRGHILDFNPYAPRTDALLFTYEDLQALSEANSDTPVLRVIDSRSHTAATRNAPVNSHNMIPFEVLDMSSGKDIDTFAETWQRSTQKSMDEEV